MTCLAPLNKNISGYIFVFFFCLISVNSTAATNNIDKPVLHPAIPILDEAGNHVLNSKKPYSPKTTCGTAGCHDYEKITHAYHFEMGRDEASDTFGAKRGFPQLVSPGYFGGYACMGGSNPEVLAKKENASENDFADKGTPGLVQRCAGCHQGGGWMEKDRNGNRFDEVDPATITHLDGDYFNRGTDTNNKSTHDSSVISQWDWKKSGVVEADCMMCHADFSNLLRHEGSPASEQISRQFSNLRRKKLINEGNFRFANSAIFEFINLKYAGGKTEDTRLLTFDKTTKAGRGFDYDLTRTDDLPQLSWNASAFDENQKVSIPMLKFPGNDNCMTCHRTSNSRRGFYGFGDSALAQLSEEDGTLIEDYQDDVHKGKTWKETNKNGVVVERNIENCNSCHSNNYFDPDYSNVHLNADHNILKGNSDMDVRNDLDFSPNAKSCEYCHDEAPNKAIPSGHDSMLSAHLERWKLSGDMTGYPKSALTRITKTHLDVISCQACHINGKKSRGRDIKLSYRYRQAEDGKLKIIPYNPRIRAYWKDKNSGYIMNRTERNSVFKSDPDNNKIAYIVHPQTKERLAQVSARFSHGSLRFGDPDSVEGIKALKRAYDAVLTMKGKTNVDTAMVWTESNEYVISHNTRPASVSVQCEECHEKKQSGSFSALVSQSGILGSSNSRQVTKLPHRSLVDDGTVLLELDYMKVTDDNTVMENVSDILHSTKVDPFMTILKASSSKAWAGELSLKETSATLVSELKLSDDAKNLLDQQFIQRKVFVFRQTLGNAMLRRVALLLNGNDSAYQNYRYELLLADKSQRDNAAALKDIIVKSEVVSLHAINSKKPEAEQNTRQISQENFFIRLPYDGTQTQADKVTVLHSDDGKQWQKLPEENILQIVSQSDNKDGYVLVRSNEFGSFAVANINATETVSPAPGEGKQEKPAASSSSGGTQAPWFIALISLLAIVRRRNVRVK